MNPLPDYSRHIDEAAARCIDACFSVDEETWPLVVLRATYFVESDPRTDSVIQRANKQIGSTLVTRTMMIVDIVCRVIDSPEARHASKVDVSEQAREIIVATLKSAGKSMIDLFTQMGRHSKWKEIDKSTRCLASFRVMPNCDASNEGKGKGQELGLVMDPRVPKLVSILRDRECRPPHLLNDTHSLRVVIFSWLVALVKRYVPIIGPIVEESQKLGLFQETVWRALRMDYAMSIGPKVAGMSRGDVDLLVMDSLSNLFGESKETNIQGNSNSSSSSNSNCCLVM